MASRILALGAAGALAATLVTTPAYAQGKPVNFVLNWVPGGDHAPVYWAKETGLYKAVGLNVTIETGRGSGFSAQRVGSGTAQLGISDMATVLQARSKGADNVGVMMIYAQSPYGIYWKKSSGIKSYKELKGKKIGAPPFDAARQMWPAIARAIGLKAEDVNWVNIAPEAKVASLKSGAVDATTHFFNTHYIYERTFGADMGFVALRDIGFNPHGNAVIANGAFLKSNKKAVADFVKVTQKAYAACVANSKPCNEVVAKAASQPVAEVDANWKLVEILMRNDTTTNVGLGFFDPKRMEQDAAMVTEVFKTPAPVKAADAFTNAFLDGSVKMKK